jgi:hypothetical protein
LVLAACAVGCSKPAETVQAAVATAMVNNALAAKGQHIDAAKAMEALTAMQKQGPKRDIVNFQKLTPLLPDAPAGWTAQEPEGRTVTAGAYKVSEASRHYHKGNAQITVTITDMAQNPAAPMLAMAFAVTEESTTGYRRPYTAGGVTGSEQWTKASKQSEISAVTPNQIMVVSNGGGLDSPDENKDLFGKIDMAKLSALQP